MSSGVVEAAAKPSFNLFNKNLLYSLRPDDGPKNSIEGAGPWVRMTSPQNPNGNSQFEKADELIQSMNYMTGMLANNSMFGAPAMQSKDVPKENSKQYKMVYETPDHTKCEQCDENGHVKGTMMVKDNGVKKIINYEAMTAKDTEEPPMNMIPSMLRNQQNSGIGGQPDGPTMPLQFYNQFAPQMNEQMAMPSNIPMQLGQLTNAMPQPSVSPLSSQLQLTPQQNNIPYNMLAQVNSVLQNGVTPQTSSPIGTFTSQTPAVLSNADQLKQQQILYQRLAAVLAPSSQVEQQLVAQRVNELMGASPNQRQPSASPLASTSTWPSTGFLLVSPSSPRGDGQAMMLNLGGSQTRDASAVQSKEQAIELNPSDASRTEETVMKKLAAEIMGMIPKNDDSKEPSEQTASSDRG